MWQITKMLHGYMWMIWSAFHQKYLAIFYVLLKCFELYRLSFQKCTIRGTSNNLSLHGDWKAFIFVGDIVWIHMGSAVRTILSLVSVLAEPVTLRLKWTHSSLTDRTASCSSHHILTGSFSNYWMCFRKRFTNFQRMPPFSITQTDTYAIVLFMHISVHNKWKDLTPIKRFELRLCCQWRRGQQLITYCLFNLVYCDPQMVHLFAPC